MCDYSLHHVKSRSARVGDNGYRDFNSVTSRMLREACGLAGPAGHESRTIHQPQGSEDARHHLPALAPRPRRRGDRMIAAMKLHAAQRRRGGPARLFVGKAAIEQP